MLIPYPSFTSSQQTSRSRLVALNAVFSAFDLLLSFSLSAVFGIFISLGSAGVNERGVEGRGGGGGDVCIQRPFFFFWCVEKGGYIVYRSMGVISFISHLPFNRISSFFDISGLHRFHMVFPPRFLTTKKFSYVWIFPSERDGRGKRGKRKGLTRRILSWFYGVWEMYVGVFLGMGGRVCEMMIE